MSTNERFQILAMICLCCSGSMFGSAALTELVWGSDPVSSDYQKIWLTIAAGLGAVAAAFFVRASFGKPGDYGSIIACAGIVNATLLLGIVAGTLLLPVFGTIFGPWLLMAHTFEGHHAILPWALSLYALHLARGGELRDF